MPGSSSDDRRRFRDVIGRWPTGVAVITANGPSGPVGLTANAIASLSLDPLLLLVCFDNNARTLPIVRDTGRFAVNVLAAGQDELSRVFASKRPETEKFADVGHDLLHGVPIIAGAHAWIVCDLEELLPRGDHTIGIGAVREMDVGDGEPLVFHEGAYRALGG